MLSKDLVNEKLELIKEYLEELNSIINMDQEEILANPVNLRALERNFQLIVDEILDINLHFIRELELKPPSDFQNTFEILGTADILPLEFAAKIAPVVGLRNRIVHRYEDIDRKFLIGQVKKEYGDFIEYIRLISAYFKPKD